MTVIKAKCAPYLRRGKPARRTRLVNNDDHTIIAIYGAEYRGIVQYYLLAGNVWRLDRLRWVMATSLLKTLARKHHSTVSKMATRYMATITTPDGPRRCFQATVDHGNDKPRTARFGGIPLRRKKDAVLSDRVIFPVATRRTELINRLLRGRCEMCKDVGEMEVHHVGKLAHLTTPGQPQPPWAVLMAKRRRKTLVVCETCHQTIHTRQPTATLTTRSPESRMR
ncbi:MAG: group II intron reverse transcriptase/maturase [Pseudonocardiaceae bacterium]